MGDDFFNLEIYSNSQDNQNRTISEKDFFLESHPMKSISYDNFYSSTCFVSNSNNLFTDNKKFAFYEHQYKIYGEIGDELKVTEKSEFGKLTNTIDFETISGNDMENWTSRQNQVDEEFSDAICCEGCGK